MTQNMILPLYEKVEGWRKPTVGTNNLENLPNKALRYIRRLEKLIECPIEIVSTSPERKDTILLKNLFG